MSNTKKTVPRVGKDTEQLKFSYTGDRNENGRAKVEDSLAVSFKS